MTRALSRLAALAVLAIAGAAAQSQTAPQGPPQGIPGGYAPPGGMAAGVTGNSPSISQQVDEMNRHINGEREHARASSAHADRARPATAADVIAGASVNDS